jgi:hypothetical protein
MVARLLALNKRDDKDHLKKLDPYLRSLKLDAIDMAVLQPFIRDRKSKDGVSNATVNRALKVVRPILNVAHQDWRWLKRGAEDSDAEGTPSAWLDHGTTKSGDGRGIPLNADAVGGARSDVGTAPALVLHLFR